MKATSPYLNKPLRTIEEAMPKITLPVEEYEEIMKYYNPPTMPDWFSFEDRLKGLYLNRWMLRLGTYGRNADDPEFRLSQEFRDYRLAYRDVVNG